MRRLLPLVFFVLTGCANAKTVSYSDLKARSESWKEPKVAIWYYQGSDEIYHYFRNQDLGKSEDYRVLRTEKTIEDEFQLNNDQSDWVVMPWGPFAIH